MPDLGNKSLKYWAMRFLSEGPLLFALGCINYVHGYLSGDYVSAVLGGLFWMSAIMQFSLANTVPKWQVETSE